MESTQDKNPYRNITLPAFLLITAGHIICSYLFYAQGSFLWPLALLIPLGFYVVSLIPYGISIWLFKKKRIEESTLIWEWTCFALFITINMVLFYSNSIELSRPVSWPFG